MDKKLQELEERLREKQAEMNAELKKLRNTHTDEKMDEMLSIKRRELEAAYKEKMERMQNEIRKLKGEEEIHLKKIQNEEAKEKFEADIESKKVESGETASKMVEDTLTKVGDKRSGKKEGEVDFIALALASAVKGTSIPKGAFLSGKPQKPAITHPKSNNS